MRQGRHHLRLFACFCKFHNRKTYEPFWLQQNRFPFCDSVKANLPWGRASSRARFAQELPCREVHERRITRRNKTKDYAWPLLARPQCRLAFTPLFAALRLHHWQQTNFVENGGSKLWVITPRSLLTLKLQQRVSSTKACCFDFTECVQGRPTGQIASPCIINHSLVQARIAHNHSYVT